MKGNPQLYPPEFRISDWLPTTRKEMDDLGWSEADVILFSGDAYVDHPAFGASVIGRVLQSKGYKVAIVPQPNWRDDLRDFKKLGKPRMFFGITAGNMDSMVNHYTANRRLRSNDAYSIGGASGFRPDRAVSVYAAALRKLFPDSVIVAGGIEASLRRFAHYDYWSDQVLPGILADRDIDYLIYGNGEKAILELANRIASDSGIEGIRNIRQLSYHLPAEEPIPGWDESKTIELDSFNAVCVDKKAFARTFKIIEEESNVLDSARLVQDHTGSRIVVNPPYLPPSSEELDSWHDLPYTRLPHPKYWNKPLIPAFEMIRFSVNIHRGCFGGCSFCTISAHQGKHVSSRTDASILSEIGQVSSMPGFKGYLSDIGGPSANMFRMSPTDRSKCSRCRRPSCVQPKICGNINISHRELISLLKKVRQLPTIKKAFISSGIRYDLFLNERAEEDTSLKEYPIEIIRHHVSGRLKVAPEHTQDHILHSVRKPSFSKFLELKALFDETNQKAGLRQELIPYFISSLPGCTFEDMAELAIRTRSLNLKTDQIQDFTPTPLTLATTIFYTGLDPYTLKPVFTATRPKDKQEQKAFFFSSDPVEKSKIKAILMSRGRQDLISRLYGDQKLKHVKPGYKQRRNK